LNLWIVGDAGGFQVLRFTDWYLQTPHGKAIFAEAVRRQTFLIGPAQLRADCFCDIRCCAGFLDACHHEPIPTLRRQASESGVGQRCHQALRHQRASKIS
jgi:hypothetical protein